MANDYSVYFGSRKIILISNLRDFFRNHNGLFVERTHKDDLTKVLVFFQTSRINTIHIFGDSADLLLKELSSNYTRIDAAGGLVRNSKGDVLLIFRSGVWDLPKGKVDDGEDYKQAALREVEEECGVDSLTINGELTTTFHTYMLNGERVLKRTVWYSMACSSSNPLLPQMEEGITQALWVSPASIPEYITNTYGSIRDVFTSAGLG